MSVIMPIQRMRLFDPPSELTDLREETPLSRLSYPDGHVGWLVTGYSLARTVLADKRFSASRELQRLPIVWKSRELIIGHPARPGIFSAMDPPEHTRIRRLLTSEFTVNKIELLRPLIEETVREHLDAMVDAGPPIDLVSCFAVPIPTIAICKLLGVPREEEDAFHRANAILNSFETAAEEGAAAWEETTEMLRKLIRQRRGQPSNDLLSNLAMSDELTEDELAGIGLLLLLAGSETTASMLGLGTFALLTHPRQLELLRENPGWIDNAVEELLRYLSILQFSVTRTALEDIDMDGHLVKSGDSVTISLPAANRDPERFDDPDELDVTRQNRAHIAFGFGIHQCIGQHLARLEMRVGYEALFGQFPDLRLAVSPEEVQLRRDMAVYGVHSLPVTW